MARSAFARATWEAGSVWDRATRTSHRCSSEVSSLRGSFWRRVIGGLLHILSNGESLRVEQLRRDYRHLRQRYRAAKNQWAPLGGGVFMRSDQELLEWAVPLLMLSRVNLAAHQQRPRAHLRQRPPP